MTSRPQPHVRDSGAGPAVVCLHANASHGGQWRALATRLAATHRVLAVDSYGAGQSPEWPSDRTISLADEVALLEPAFDALGRMGPITHADVVNEAIEDFLRRLPGQTVPRRSRMPTPQPHCPAPPDPPA